LYLSRIVDGGKHLSKRAKRRRRVTGTWIIEIRVIERIEELAAQLKRITLSDGEVLEQA
jgi:hypothetical protein